MVKLSITPCVSKSASPSLILLIWIELLPILVHFSSLTWPKVRMSIFPNFDGLLGACIQTQLALLVLPSPLIGYLSFHDKYTHQSTAQSDRLRFKYWPSYRTTSCLDFLLLVFDFSLFLFYCIRWPAAGSANGSTLLPSPP